MLKNRKAQCFGGPLLFMLAISWQALSPGNAAAATGSFEFSAATYRVNEGAGKVDVVVKRAGGASGAASVDIRTNSQTATFNADYASFSWTTMKFVAPPPEAEEGKFSKWLI